MQTKHVLLPVAAAAVGLATLAVSAGFAGGATGTATFQPKQALSYTLGSKRVIGYFVPEAGACRLTLMIAEAIDPEMADTLSAARVQLALAPGQSAAVDSVEGHAVAINCGRDGNVVAVGHTIPAF